MVFCKTTAQIQCILNKKGFFLPCFSTIVDYRFLTCLPFVLTSYSVGGGYNWKEGAQV